MSDYIAVLVAYVEGRINHMNRGYCPDDVNGHAARDPQCSVCVAMQAALSRPEAKVTEEMVERACARFYGPNGAKGFPVDEMRAALEAALCTNNQEIAR